VELEPGQTLSLIVGDVPDVRHAEAGAVQIRRHDDWDTSIHVVFGADEASRRPGEEQAPGRRARQTICCWAFCWLAGEVAGQDSQDRLDA
jgi:hypothetical protein